MECEYVMDKDGKTQMGWISTEKGLRGTTEKKKVNNISFFRASALSLEYVPDTLINILKYKIIKTAHLLI